jgi:ubiquinone/menaquinone biosynthesis C-methylase UbiE
MALFQVLDRLAHGLGRLVMAFLLWLLFFNTVVRLVRRYWHFPAPPFIAIFLNSPLRRALQPPSEVVDAAGLGPGMVVLELGPGPGTFTLEAARRVGHTGRVVAVDVEAAMVARLAAAVARAGLSNVEVQVADAYQLPAPDASVDVALLVTVLAEIPDRQRALAELKRVLKPEGSLAISEFVIDPDYPRASTVTRWCQQAGFRLEESHRRTLWYLLTFRPA